ncbi:MAG: prepilin-type N-terminal cleavage/methylation domain-containing protein [Legionellales bacterium]|nr:prepilin-type N-terminal cleavage/methylation domain-containing protein [Legionellales bacterium]
MNRNTSKYMSGFSFLEMILSIVIISILSVAVLGSLIKPFNEKVVDFNDIQLVVNNTEEIFSSVLKKYGPESVPGLPFSINDYSRDCSEEISPGSIEYLLCKSNDFGNNVKYSINSTVSGSSISAPPLQEIEIWEVEYAIVFYVRKSIAASWNEYITVNRILKVQK